MQILAMAARALPLLHLAVAVQPRAMGVASGLLQSQLLAYCAFMRHGLRRPPPSPADVTRWLLLAFDYSGQYRSLRLWLLLLASVCLWRGAFVLRALWRLPPTRTTSPAAWRSKRTKRTCSNLSCATVIVRAAAASPSASAGASWPFYERNSSVMPLRLPMTVMLGTMTAAVQRPDPTPQATGELPLPTTSRRQVLHLQLSRLSFLSKTLASCLSRHRRS